MISDLEYYRVKDNVNSYYRIESESKKELLLNKYPNAAAAYSLRLLDGYYREPLVRVRRNDGVEVDVYPDYNNQLSLDSLVTNVDPHTTNDGIEDQDYTFVLVLQSFGEFVGHDGYSSLEPPSTATVCVWYDQSGNQNNAEQDAASSQPLIYDSVAGDLVRENGNLALSFSGSNQLNSSANLGFSGANARSIFQVIQKNFSGNPYRPFQISPSTTSGRRYRFTTDWGIEVAGGFRVWSSADLTQSLLTLIFPTGSTAVEDHLFYKDGTALSPANTNPEPMDTLDNPLIIGEGFNGKIQEQVFYASDQTSNRGGIEQDINSFYQIDGYTPTPKLIDLTQDLAVENGGTIADGTPAAAYSLRLLSSTYNGPLVRIRRTIDNTEVDVYPDSDGEFSIYSTIEDGGTELTTGVTGGSTDKTTLHEFLYGQDTDCMVVVWYDQAGSNDATQTTTGTQPKIYDSISGVVTDANGDATLDGDATTLTYMSLTSNVVMNTDWSVFMAGDFLNGDRTAGSGSYMFLVNTQTSSTSARSDISSGITTSWPLGSTGSRVWSLNMDSSTGNFNLRVNGADSNQTANTANYTVTDLFYYGNVSLWTKGSIKEVILYQSSQYDNRTGIEQNINQHYNIY